MKSVDALSKRQVELLLGIWHIAHNAMNHARQPFLYQVDSVDEAEWKDLINSGYIEPIPDVENRFIMTSLTDGIYNDLVTFIVKI